MLLRATLCLASLLQELNRQMYMQRPVYKGCSAHLANCELEQSGSICAKKQFKDVRY